MPTYEYACTECGHSFEIVQSFSDDALTECPECHGALRKVFGSVGIVFKGSGFYKTDTRGGPSAVSPAKSPESGAGDSSSSSTSTSAESSTPAAASTPSAPSNAPSGD
jgi:putative FmdB family regulatory protein